MPQRLGSTPLLVLLLLSGAARAADARLAGRFRGEGLGELEFRTADDGRVVARHVSGGACAFAPEAEVVSGRLEGNVLVGSLTLCQQGVSCATRAYPVLAFVHGGDGSLTAHLKLEAGCSSPALRNGALLRLAPVPLGEAAPVAAAPPAPRAEPLSAAEQKRFERAFTRGAGALERSRFEEASRHFGEALALDPTNWGAHLGLGVAHFGRGDAEAALREYALARRYNPEEKDVYFNIACAHARLRHREEALGSLREAVARGFEEAEMMAGDADLSALLGQDLEFQRLLAQVRSRAAAPGARGR
jgi:hypothetical protein